MTENFPKLMSDIKAQIQETQRIPTRKNANNNNTSQVYHIQSLESQRE